MVAVAEGGGRMSILVTDVSVAPVSRVFVLGMCTVPSWSNEWGVRE